MARFTQFRPRSNLPIILRVIAVAVIGFAATAIFMAWQGIPAVEQTAQVQILLWWQQRNVDPLNTAQRLWQHTRSKSNDAPTSAIIEPGLRSDL